MRETLLYNPKPKSKQSKARKRVKKGLWEMHDDSGRTLSDFQKGQMELDKLRRKVFDANDDNTI